MNLFLISPQNQCRTHSPVLFSISTVSEKAKSAIFVDVASPLILSLHSVEESKPSLASDAFLFATVVAVKRGVGGARLRGELFH